MSDIIYNPPATGGGGGQNPTPSVIPYNNGSSNFSDSNIATDVNNYIGTYTNHGTGDPFGWFIDFNNNIIQLGDISAIFDTTLLTIDSNTQQINTYHYGYIGLSLNFLNNGYSIGDFGALNNGSYINIADNGRYIYLVAGENSNGNALLIDELNGITKTIYAGNEKGLRFDYLHDTYLISTGIYSSLFIEDHIGTYSSILLTNTQNDDRGLTMTFDNHINDTNYNLTLGSSANGTGLNLQFNPDSNVDIIQLNTRGGGNTLTLDDISNKMTFTTSTLNFVGGSLTDTTIVTPVGRNLKVTINGTTYHIPLYN